MHLQHEQVFSIMICLEEPAMIDSIRKTIRRGKILEDRIIARIAQDIGAQIWQVQAAVGLLDGGSTVPFIARYRKEATGALGDDTLRALEERLKYLRNLEDRKQTVLASIEEQGKLTDDLRNRISLAETAAALEDLYRPYKPKRRTRADIAREKGLQGLADWLMSPGSAGDPLTEAAGYTDPEKDVCDAETAIALAMDIIAGDVADNADYRACLKDIENDLIESGIEGILSDNIKRDALLKFSYVSPQGACGLYYNVPAGKIQEPGKIRDCFIGLIREIDALANAIDIHFEEDIVERNLAILDSLSPSATTSLQRDIMAGRDSEIDGLIFEVVRLADKYGVNLPLYTKIAKYLS